MADDEDPTVSGANTTAVSAERLAAVRLLLTEDRTAQTTDILLASVFEHLTSGPKTVQEIVGHVRRMWPGVSIEQPTLTAVLGEAEVRGFVRKVSPDLGGLVRWELEPTGGLDLDQPQEWADGTLSRLNTSLAEAAREETLAPTAAQVQAWSEVLQQAVLDTVSAAFARDATVEIVGGHLFPDRYNLSVGATFIRQRCQDDRVAEFLELMVEAAFDQSEPFGTELVHNFALGYVLYAYVGRRDNPDARAAVGPLQGEIAILDTPLLVRLLSDGESKTSLLEAIGRARNAGYTVVIHRRTFHEVTNALDFRQEEAAAVERDLRQGADRMQLSRFTRDGWFKAWLDAEPTGNAAFVHWTDFRRQAEQLETTLAALGVEMVEVAHKTLADSTRHEEFKQRLVERLKQRGSDRHPELVAHDATMLVTAARGRDVNPPNDDKVWPGAIVVSPDSYLNDTYRDVMGTQTFPVAITVGQWVSVLASCSPPVEVEELAAVISKETSARTLLTRAAGFPIEATLEFVRSLGHAPLSTAQAAAVQQSLDEILASQPDVGSARGDDARRIGQQVLDRHMRRTRAAFEYHSDRQAEETSRLQARAEDSERREHRHRQEATEREREQTATMKELRAEVESLSRAVQAQNDDDEAAASRRSVRRARAMWVVPLVVAASVLSVVLTVLYFTGDLSQGRLALAGWAGTGIAGWFSYEALRSTEEPLPRLLAAAIIVPAAWLALELLLG